MVCSALDSRTNTRVAIKKLNHPFLNAVNAKRALRELMLLKSLKHDNIIELLDSFTSQLPGSSPDIYLVTNLMGSDLFGVLQAQIISEQHTQFFVYQILRGLLYLHSAKVIHRDLKPGNIAVNERCDIKILDFGLARPSATEGTMTGYVQTRWYRTPEIILGCPYDEKADMWSVGCILAEMLCARVVFPGVTPVDQIAQFTSTLGPIPESVISTIASQATRQYFLETRLNDNYNPENSIEKQLSHCTPAAVDLVRNLLRYSPAERFSAKQALAHPYLADYHDPGDEPEAPAPFNDAFESVEMAVDQLQAAVLQQVREVP